MNLNLNLILSACPHEVNITHFSKIFHEILLSSFTFNSGLTDWKVNFCQKKQKNKKKKQDRIDKNCYNEVGFIRVDQCQE